MVLNFLRSFFPPKYVCFLLLGRQEGKPLWHHNNWSPVATALDPIFKETGGQVSISPSYGHRQKRRRVKFRGIRWNDQSHCKWCLGTVENLEEDQDLRYFAMNIWCPTLSQCNTNPESVRPIIYIDVNEYVPDEEISLPHPWRADYDQYCVIIIKQDFYQEKKSQIDSLIKLFSEKMNLNMLLRQTDRRLDGPVDFSSFILNYFSYLKQYIDPFPDLAKLKGNWEKITLEDL